MLLLILAAHAQDVTIRDALTTGTTATTVYGGSFTGAGWRVDDSNSRLYWDFGTQVNRGTVRFTTDDITLDNLVGDNNEFLQLFDTGDKWSCTRAIEVRAYGDLEASSHGDIKLKTWDNTSGLYSEARGGVQVWDGNPHTWTVTWDETTATLQRDGVEIVRLDVTGQDLSVGTMWLPLNSWTGGYSHPIGSVYSDVQVDAWEPGGGGGEDTGVPPSEGRQPIEDVGVSEGLGSTVYTDADDLPVEGSGEGAYLMFDLSDLSGTVVSATLHLHAQSDSHADGDGGSVYVVQDTSWDEDTLSWATRPALVDLVGSFGAVSAGDEVVIDVTAGVHTGGRVALALANGGGNGVHFWSKEGSGAPTLEVTTSSDGGGGGTDSGGGDSGGGGGGVDTAGSGDTADPADPADTGRDPKAPGGMSDMDEGGCGCATGGPSLAWVGLLALLLVRRRG